MKRRKSLLIVSALTALTLLLSSCAGAGGGSSSEPEEKDPDVKTIVLSDDTAKIDGTEIPEYDYTWKADPSMEEPQLTGTEPGGEAVYIAHDIIYYPEIEADQFAKEQYDGETEWVTHYTAEGLEDYLFSTLPVLGEDLPTEMMHDADEAYENQVLHITEAGTYCLEGSWSGQIWVDLKGDEDCFTDEEAKIKLILNGVDVTCTVAPAVVFYDAYECDNTWEEREEAVSEIDISDAGAQVVLADGTENNVTGANVYRMLKPTYKKEGSTVQKKLWKMDGAFYSFVSLRVDGEEKGTGILNITSTTFEGLDSELHLCVDGGYINIVSQDDGINVNEDGVSVLTVNGGHLVIFAGQGAEGDVIDSNGYIDINGGFVAGTSPSVSDNMLDSDCGTDVSDDAVIVSSTGGAMEGTPPDGRGGPGETEPPNGMEPPEGFEPGQIPERNGAEGEAPPEPRELPQ